MLQRYAAPERLSCAAKSRPMTSSTSAQNKPFLTQEAKGKSLKLKERTGNVYENKGTVWKDWERTGNVIENKGT